jgi:hypothetical protein
LLSINDMIHILEYTTIGGIPTLTSAISDKILAHEHGLL